MKSSVVAWIALALSLLALAISVFQFFSGAGTVLFPERREQVVPLLKQ